MQSSLKLKFRTNRMTEPVDNEAIEERKRKRAERREKQRKENVGRAAKMHELRVASHACSGLLDLADTQKTPDRLHIGCSGWIYWHWRGRFYPETLATNQWFRHYAKHFDTVELNAPFYSWPTAATVKSWSNQTGRKRFIYT